MRAERADLMDRLAKLCGLSAKQWAARTRRIQLRVERIAAGANRRRQAEMAEPAGTDESWAARIRRLLLEKPPAPRIIVAEELACHVVTDDVPAPVADEIKTHAARYPGAKIVELSRRTYPGGTLAAHVLGHLGPADERGPAEPREPQWTATCLPDELVGRMGVERQYETVLRGRRGVAVEQTDHGGRVVASYRSREPLAGRDVVLTLDAALQRTAEEPLHSALQRRALAPGATSPAGGRHRRHGRSRRRDSRGRFSPRSIPIGSPAARARDSPSCWPIRRIPCSTASRAMAIPPGSAFKVLTAAALLQSAAVGPHESFLCRGYLHRPDQQRCQIYVRQGVGHGEVTLADALAVSCNVYFFHFAGQMGPRPLVHWAELFGFGRLTGVDLPGEAAGTLPSPENIRQLEGHAWRTVDTQSMAIGQGSLRATPLQVLRMIAAVASGGHLPTPHVEKRGRSLFFGFGFVLENPAPDSRRAAASRLRSTRHRPCHGAPGHHRRGRQDRHGRDGRGGAGHAWFAGYAPTDAPKLAFVVVLEHAGDAAATAGPLAKRLVLRMEELGML